MLLRTSLHNVTTYASFWVRSEISWVPCPTHPSKPTVFGAPENVYSISSRQRANRLLFFQNKTFLWSKFRKHFMIRKNCSCSTHGPDGQVCPSVSPGDALGITASRKKSQGKTRHTAKGWCMPWGPDNVKKSTLLATASRLLALKRTTFCGNEKMNAEMQLKNIKKKYEVLSQSQKRTCQKSKVIKWDQNWYKLISKLPSETSLETSWDPSFQTCLVEFLGQLVDSDVGGSTN